MNDSMVDRLDDHEPITESLEIPQPRAVGAPLPRGNGSRVQLPQTYNDLENMQPIPTPGPILAPSPTPAHSSGPVLASPQSAPSASPSQPSQRALTAPKEPTTGFQRAIGAVRRALPIVQRILPLLDGNIATAISNILTPPPPASAPPARIDLTPIHASISELQSTHRELRDQVTQQNASLKRVEDQLEMVREATDRNTLEQQELLEDLKSTGRKVNVVAVIVIGLLTISLLVNIELFLHIRRVLP
jgi:hypothetical protein